MLLQYCNNLQSYKKAIAVIVIVIVPFDVATSYLLGYYFISLVWGSRAFLTKSLGVKYPPNETVPFHTEKEHRQSMKPRKRFTL